MMALQAIRSWAGWSMVALHLLSEGMFGMGCTTTLLLILNQHDFDARVPLQSSASVIVAGCYMCASASSSHQVVAKHESQGHYANVLCYQYRASYGDMA